MFTETPSEQFNLRLTPSLKRALNRRARKLGIRATDLARVVLARECEGEIEPARGDEPALTAA